MRTEMWYDRHIRMWTITGRDDKGNQVGDAQYAGSKREALDIRSELRKMPRVKASRKKLKGIIKIK